MKLWHTIGGLALAFIATSASAETVTVKYRGPVPLDSFQCRDTESSFVERVCYDAAQQYMVIRLKGTYYHYCEIDEATVAGLLAAPSTGKFFNAHIKGSGADGPFDCRTHRVPSY
ncbi:KTSC domain-containing protein [Aestuariivirga sp.]|uniref:KTSC domain-containing protein n=1 Tax=Aestuariivirga sp. TaxID=2650926 RepID=UPI0039E6B02F